MEFRGYVSLSLKVFKMNPWESVKELQWYCDLADMFCCSFNFTRIPFVVYAEFDRAVSVMHNIFR